MSVAGIAPSRRTQVTSSPTPTWVAAGITAEEAAMCAAIAKATAPTYADERDEKWQLALARARQEANPHLTEEERSSLGVSSWRTMPNAP